MTLVVFWGTTEGRGKRSTVHRPQAEVSQAQEHLLFNLPSFHYLETGLAFMHKILKTASVSNLPKGGKMHAWGKVVKDWTWPKVFKIFSKCLLWGKCSSPLWVESWRLAFALTDPDDEERGMLSEAIWRETCEKPSKRSNGARLLESGHLILLRPYCGLVHPSAF